MWKRFFVLFVCGFVLLSCASCGPGGLALLALIGASGGGDGGDGDSNIISVTVTTSIGAGTEVIVDGTTYPAPYTANWVKGETHNIDVPSPQYQGTDTRYIFDSWSDGGAQNHDVSPTASVTYTAYMDAQYLLTTSITPAGGGSVSVSPPSAGGDDFYDDGDVVQLTANPSAGYGFWRWSGDLSGTNNPETVTMNRPKDITAEFVLLPVANFSAATTTYYGTPASVTFTDASSGDIVQWEWDFDGGGFDISYNSYQPTVSWTYSNPGAYTVTLRVTGPAGHTDEMTIQKYIIVYGDTIYVDWNGGDDVNNYGTTPSDAVKTIQRGIDLANDGMTVLVADGTYIEFDIDFTGKAITVQSSGGAANCTVDCNSAGRGFFFGSGETSSSVLDGFTIVNGYVDSADGGGILCDGTSPTIRNCIIKSCSAGVGGGVSCQNSASPLITDCVITQNEVTNNGGGIVCNSSSPTITNCSIADNYASANGGGIVCVSSSPTITNCTITGNGASGNGGGVFCDLSSPTITNCTIADNNASANGGGIYFSSSSTAVMNNCILWGNTATNGNQGWIEDAGSTVTMNHCCFANGPNDGGGDHGPIEFNCFYSDPDFRDAPNGDYHLKCGSPCFDKGDKFAVPATITTDLDGNTRIMGVSVDIGAYELNVIRVPADYATIQAGIDAAGDWDVVLLAPGRYTGAGNKDLDIRGKRIAVRSEFGPETCIIDCENSGRGFVFQSSETPDTVLEGITITNGSSTSGGGISCNGSSPTIRYCYIEDCSATSGDGGGIYCTSSSPVIIGCKIRFNTSSTGSGGGIFLSNSSPQLESCLISENVAEDNGGGVFCYNSSAPVLTNCTIAGNKVNQFFGGGICSAVNSAPILNNTIIWANSASDGNQIYAYSNNTSITLNNCCYSNDSGDVNVNGTPFTTPGCIAANPLFFDPTDHDYHLLPGSPCIDLGDDSYVNWDYDLDGTISTQRIRIWGPNVDIGCYEGAWHPVPSMYTTIQDAINAALDGDLVVVEPGTYTGAGNKNLTFGGKRVILYADTEEGGECVIDCEGSGRGFNFNSGEGPFTAVVGFTIKNGNASDGGAIYCNGSSPTIINCIMQSNTSSLSGGAVYCTDSHPTLINCLMENNSAGTSGNGGGGGIYCFSGASPRVINCTLKDNWSQFSGGGIRSHASAGRVILINCIVWSNTSASSANEIMSEGGTVTAYCSNADSTECTGVNWGTPNMDADPQFASNGWGHLKRTSPCIDAGDNSVVRWIMDPDNKPRVLDGDNDSVAVVEMGCFEGAMFVVPTDYATIQEAINAAFEFDIVLVEDGVYTGTGNKDLNLLGKNIWVRSRNGPASCIIDCENSGRGFIITSGEGDRCVIQGFQILNASTADDGGGIYINNSSPTVINCVLDSCSATNDGGGIYLENSDSHIVGCTIQNCSATGNGGGIFLDSSYPTIWLCTISSNTATSYGGAIYCVDSSPTVLLCSMTHNTAVNGGGAIYCGNNGSSSPYILNCLIANNEATGSGSGGGGVYCYNNSGTLTLINCTLANNACGWNGGGIYNYHSSGTSYIELHNCIIWGNAAANNYNQIATFTGSQVDLYYCCYADGANDIGGVGSWSADPNCISADPATNPNYPKFADAGSPGASGGGDFHLQATSPCIDTGYNDVVFWDVDLDGESRIVDGGSGTATVDMGVYEY